MGRQARLKKMRKFFKDESLLQEIDETPEIIREKLILFDVPLTLTNVAIVLEYVESLEKPEIIIDNEYKTFLEDKISNFIKNNLK